MSHIIDPNSPLYKRERLGGLWVGLTIVAVIIMGAAIFGLPTIASGFRYLGL